MRRRSNVTIIASSTLDNLGGNTARPVVLFNCAHNVPNQL